MSPYASSIVTRGIMFFKQPSSSGSSQPQQRFGQIQKPELWNVMKEKRELEEDVAFFFKVWADRCEGLKESMWRDLKGDFYVSGECL